jgi:hypothetical protein
VGYNKLYTPPEEHSFHTNPRKHVAIGRKGNIMDPSTMAVRVFSTQRVEGKPFSPWTWSRLLIQIFDVRREDTAFHISGAYHMYYEIDISKICWEISLHTRRQQNVVRMPVQRQDCGTDGTTQMFANPPIVVLFKVANRDTTSTTSHSKLVLLGRPFDTSGCTVDAQ